MHTRNQQLKTTPKRITLAAAVTLLTGSVTCADMFEDADRAAQESRLSDMQAIYENILQGDPSNVRALTGKAAAQSWQGKYRDAQDTYAAALALMPDDLNARVGLGYAYAWNGEFVKAHTEFNAALNTDPFDLGARKGIGYAYLWSGDYELALDSFELARSIAPEDAEIAEAYGHASLKLGHARDAIESYNRTLAFDPQRESAAHARLAAFTTAPALEVSTQYGSTSGIDSGIRAVEIAHWPSLSTRLAARYDDSLSLDNRSLAQRGQDSPGYYFGVQQSIGTRWLGQIEVGHRRLVDGGQNLLSLAGVFHAGINAVKLGAQIGRHDAGYTDELLYGAVAFPIFEKWRVEPVLFVSEFGPSEDSEWRAVINATFQPGYRWSLGLQAGRGEIDARDASFSGRTTLYGASADFYVTDQVTLHLSMRREETPGDSLDIALLGLGYRIPRN